MTLDRTGLDVVAAIVEAAATRGGLPHLRAYADAVRALPDADLLAAHQQAVLQRNAVRDWVDARMDRYPASHVAVEIGRLVEHPQDALPQERR